MEQDNIREETEGSEGMASPGPAEGPVGAEATTPTVEEEPGLQALDRKWRRGCT